MVKYSKMVGGNIMGKNKYYSKIDNTIYNLKEVQDLLSKNRQWDAI